MTQNDHEQTVDTGTEFEQDTGTESATEAHEPAAETDETAAEESQDNELDVLRAQITEVQGQAAEYLDGWQRARAEFANYRRREEQRRTQMHQQIRSDLLKRLLPVLDDMERAFQTTPDESKDDPWVQGLTMVGHKLQATLEKDGLSIMATEAGDRFDPNIHEAVLCEPSAEYDDGQIIQVLQQGYLIDDTVLRPTLVRVSSGRIETSTQGN